MAEHGVGGSPNVACEFKTGSLSEMAVRGQRCLRKLEGAAPVIPCEQLATCGVH
jgi:hypothetical protein